MAATAKRYECLEILGLKNDASLDDVKKQYKKLALRCHPDKNQDDPESTVNFQRLSEAYTYLAKDVDDDDDDDEYTEFWEDDDLLISLLRAFANLRGGEYCGCPGCAPPGATIVHLATGEVLIIADDLPKPKSKYSDRYMFACERESDFVPPKKGKKAKRAEREASKKFSKAAAKSREPSSKYQRKMAKRTNNLERMEEEAEGITENSDINNNTRPSKKRESDTEDEARKKFKYFENGNDSGDDQKMEEDYGTDGEEKENKNRKRSKKNSKQPTLTQSKPKTKKQLLAEQKRREKEMAEIAKRLEEQRKIEEEKDVQKQRDKIKQEEVQDICVSPSETYQMGEDISMKNEVEMQLIRSEQDKLKQEVLMKQLGAVQTKSKSKRKREAKQKRRKDRMEQSTKTSSVHETLITENKDLADFGSSARDTGWDSDSEGWGMSDTWPVSSGPSSCSSSSMKPASSQSLHSKEGFSFDLRKKDNHSYKFSSNYQAENNWTVGYKKGPSFSNQKSVGYSTPGYDKNHWGTQKQSNYQKSKNHYVKKQEPNPFQARPFPLPMAPPPAMNVWQDRKDFCQTATPSNEIEEDAMLRAAIEMSLIEAKEKEILKQMEEEDTARWKRTSETVHTAKSRAAPSLTTKTTPPATQQSQNTSHPTASLYLPQSLNPEPVKQENSFSDHGQIEPAQIFVPGKQVVPAERFGSFSQVPSFLSSDPVKQVAPPETTCFTGHKTNVCTTSSKLAPQEIQPPSNISSQGSMYASEKCMAPRNIVESQQRQFTPKPNLNTTNQTRNASLPTVSGKSFVKDIDHRDSEDWSDEVGISTFDISKAPSESCAYKPQLSLQLTVAPPPIMQTNLCSTNKEDQQVGNSKVCVSIPEQKDAIPKHCSIDFNQGLYSQTPRSGFARGRGVSKTNNIILRKPGRFTAPHPPGIGDSGTNLEKRGFGNETVPPPTRVRGRGRGIFTKPTIGGFPKPGELAASTQSKYLPSEGWSEDKMKHQLQGVTNNMNANKMEKAEMSASGSSSEDEDPLRDLETKLCTMSINAGGDSMDHAKTAGFARHLNPQVGAVKPTMQTPLKMDGTGDVRADLTQTERMSSHQIPGRTSPSPGTTNPADSVRSVAASMGVPDIGSFFGYGNPFAGAFSMGLPPMMGMGMPAMSLGMPSHPGVLGNMPMKETPESGHGSARNSPPGHQEPLLPSNSHVSESENNEKSQPHTFAVPHGFNLLNQGFPQTGQTNPGFPHPGPGFLPGGMPYMPAWMPLLPTVMQTQQIYAQHQQQMAAQSSQPEPSPTSPNSNKL